MKLTTEQAARLEAVAKADLAFRDLKLTLEARLRQELTTELRSAEDRRDLAAYAADVVGVPRSRIGKDGLHTTAPKAGKEAAERGRDLYARQFGPVGVSQPAFLPHEQITAAPEPTGPRFTLEGITVDPWRDANTWNAYPSFPERRRFDALIHSPATDRDSDATEPVRMWFFDPHPTKQGAYPIGPEIPEEDYARVPASVLTAARSWADAVRADNAPGQAAA